MTPSCQAYITYTGPGDCSAAGGARCSTVFNTSSHVLSIIYGAPARAGCITASLRAIQTHPIFEKAHSKKLEAPVLLGLGTVLETLPL
jgi:hypothetical protein